MAFLDRASAASKARGAEYYFDDRVKSCEPFGDGEFAGEVEGSGGELYHVKINPAHPMSSTCTCPPAAGRMIICKHMIAMYFCLSPEQAEAVGRENSRILAERRRIKLTVYVHSLTKSELQDALVEALLKLEENGIYDY